MNENENTSLESLGNTVNLVLRGKFINLNAYMRGKKEDLQINDLSFQLTKLEGEQQNKPK